MMLKQKNKKILSALLVFTFMLSNFVMFGQIKIARADTISISNSSVKVTTGSAVTVTTGAAITLDIVEITDFHGQLLDTNNKIHIGAALAKAVEEISTKNPNTLVIGGGDLYQGTPVSNKLHGVPTQQVLSRMGMEVTTLGNHEFDWGLNTINNETMKDAGYEIVCSNLYENATSKPAYKPYKIIEKGGVKIAVIGAILKDVTTIVLPANMKDYTVTDPTTEINKCAKQIRDNKEADVVLSVIHDGKESLNNIVSNLKGVDAVFGGHTHSKDDMLLKDKDDKNVPTLTACSSGKGFMNLKIYLDKDKKITFSEKGKNWVDVNDKVKVTDTTPVDEVCKDLVVKAYDKLSPIFDEVIGHDEVDYTKTQKVLPYGESQLGNWMADVVRNNAKDKDGNIFKADVGIVNNGGIRINILKGNITVGTVFNLMPFDNTVTTVKMTGAQLKTIIEQGIVDGGKGLQISGVKVTYDSSKIPYKEAVTDGERVIKIVRESDGTIIKNDEMLTVAAPDFLATGGDTFTRFLDESIAKTYNDTHDLVRDALIADIRTNKKINVIMDERLVNLSKVNPAAAMTIKEAKAAAATNVTATIEGFVSGVSGKTVFLQDDPTNPTAGIVLFNSCGATVTKGDKITVTGPLSVYYGLIEITPASKIDVSVTSQNNTITPKVVAIKDINDDLQGELIKLKKVTFTSIDTKASSTIKDSTGTTIIYKMPTVTDLKVNDVKDVTVMVSKHDNVQLVVSNQSDVTNPTEDSNSVISIVATSDVHGAAFDWDYGKNSTTGKGGLAKVSTYVNDLRASNPNVMLIDNGDTMQGTPLVYYYNMKDKTSVYPMAAAMGAMKYDTWTLGNHEFNFGLDTLDRVKKDYTKQGVKVLAANAYDSDNNNFVQPYYIKELNVNGKTVKVGILGFTNQCIPSWENPEHYKGLHFNDIVKEATKWVPIVKKAGADIVIVAAHSGEEGASDVIPENQIKALANGVLGIDAIIAGHAHSIIDDRTLKNPEGKIIPVLEPKKSAEFISRIDINLDSNNVVTGINTKNVEMNKTIVEDQNIVSIMKSYKDATLQYTGTQIGQATGAFSGKDQTMKATAIMELINKVQLQNANAQLSIAAPLSASANIPEGNITNKDIMGTYVFENYLYGVKMTGEQVKKWLEYSAKYYKQVSNETDSPEKDTKLNVPDYNLDQLYGASYDIDLTKPFGSRIVNLKYNGSLINNTDVFTVAINDYRYNGGGGFMKEIGLSNTDPSIVTYSSAKALGDDGQIRNLMISYIKDAKTISPVCSSNWKLSTKEVVIDNTGSSSSSGKKHKNNNSNSTKNTTDTSVSKVDKTQEKVSNAEIVTKKVVNTLNTIVGEGVTAEAPKQLTNVDGNKLSLTTISKEGKYVGAVVTSEKDSAVATIPLSSTKGEVKAVYKFVPLLGKYIQLSEGVTIGTDAITLPTQANATYYAATVLMDSTETVTQGWAKVADSWYLVNATGDPKTGWQKDNTGWVYLSPSNGIMQTGWNKQGNTWYHLNESGYMSTGWVKTNDKWYYLNSDGSMASNTTIADVYTLDSNGEWVA